MASVEHIVFLRKERSPVAKAWKEVGTYATEIDALAAVVWWREYDSFYSLEGWEYRIKEQRKK